ncbi:MAG TPA: GAF and ANTAR domain-containing protein [Jatrophihabitans sp.]|nr:GAF and ANTAR domain-containing protein [Jatrophihabitans sp.]
MVSDDALDAFRVFAHVARELAEQDGLGQTTERLMKLATQLTGCRVAAVWQLSPRGETVLKGATDQSLAQELDRIIAGVKEGIVHHALTHRATVHTPDVQDETRWPRYVAALLHKHLPIRSAIAYSLQLGEQQFGALALYSDRPHFFDDKLITIGGVLADHAAIALEAATLAQHNHHLKQALESNRRVGTAIGILMALNQLTEQQAFDTMRVASQHLHVKLRDVAEQIILTGATPTWTARPPLGSR